LTTPAKLAIASGICTVSVAAAAAYFVALPRVQAAEYRQAAEAKHAAVDHKLSRVYDTFTRPAFTTANTKSANDTQDIQVAAAALKDAKATLQANAPVLTKFPSLPLLGWNQDYRQAAATQRTELQYIQQAQAFLASYQTLLDHLNAATSLSVQFEQAGTKLDGTAAASSPAALATLLDGAAADMQVYADKLAALAAPSYLAATESQTVGDVRQMVVSFKGFTAVAKARNLPQMTKLSKDIETQSASMSEHEAAIVTNIQKSPLVNQISQVQDLGAKARSGFASLR
jgi:hypothetical protein